MAYIQDLQKPCHESFCPKRAMVEIFNHRNASMGLYCRDHGNKKLNELERKEREILDRLGGVR